MSSEPKTARRPDRGELDALYTYGIESVEHNYHDHADEDEGPHLLHQLILDSTKARQGADHPFPVKLHYMLGKMQEEGLSHVISWQPHGRCFVVHDHKEFVNKVLTCWFRQSKFPSFQRQLNLYGFRRLTTGRDKGGYYHEFFLRGKPLLAHRIQRTKVKGTGTRKPSSPETEPNFYLMPYVGVDGKPEQTNMVDPTGCLSLQSLIPSAVSASLDGKPEPSMADTMKRNIVDPTGCLSLQSILPTALSASLEQDATLNSMLEPRPLVNLTPPQCPPNVETNAFANLLSPLMLGNSSSATYYTNPSPIVNSRNDVVGRYGAAGRNTSLPSSENDALSNYEAILTMLARRPVNSNTASLHSSL